MIKAFALAALVFTTASAPFLAPKGKAVPSVNLSNEGNGFRLSDVSYGANQSFVYTAKVNFRSGQAAGLAFGSQENDHYFVFNIDRYENHTKLLYFHNVEGQMQATEFRSEHYIGNDKVTQSELNVIKPKVAECPEYHLKMVVTVENEHTYAEFFIDNIKRFGVDSTIDLNELGVDYQGGYVGYNVFASDVSFSDVTVGESDYSYYTEPYRNQYHYSQYAHWNNDPNGLVYYKGYYHMYYQTHPYSKYWDHMYWGHARSKDLVHWEELPYALFPDDGNMGVGLGVGYAWSGIAMVYHPGMSEAIDAKNWFPNGNGTGLLGYYTRDGMMQDQVIISSDDDGMTWTKHSLISQYLIFKDHKIDCRDPSMFPLKKDYSGKVTLWGMALGGGTQNQFWFLKSSNMLDWEFAGGYDYQWPECVSVYPLKSESGQEYHVITVSSRSYAIGHLYYNDITGLVEFVLADGREYSTVGQSAFRPLDYAQDSYAGQGFYIDDPESKYYGKTIAINWNAGLPNEVETGAYAKARDPWNGSMTMPVEFKIVGDGASAELTQTPITRGNEDFDKTQLISRKNATVNEINAELEKVNTHVFELEATLENSSGADVEFRVALSEDEYTAFGWDRHEGYYFDRSHTSTAGIPFVKKYNHRFVSGQGLDDTTLSFYVLCDNGIIEIFCGGFRYAFYGVIFSAPYSIGATLVAPEDNVTVTSLEINAIGSIWHEDSEIEEGVLYLDQEDLDLDLSLCASKDVLVYSTNHEEISYQLVSGEGVVSYEPIAKGVRIESLAQGEAEIKAITASQSKSIFVHVDDADIDCDLDLSPEGVKSGSWRKSSQGLVGTSLVGDGYLLSDTEASDFQFSATMSLESAAAGLVVRADETFRNFVVCNVDANERIVKVFSSSSGELGRAPVDLESFEEVSYLVSVNGLDLEVAVNGKKALRLTLPFYAHDSGYLGFNVFNGKATFDNIRLSRLGYEYFGDDVEVGNAGGQYIKALYNQTEKNSLVPAAYYSQVGETIVLSRDYLNLLEEGKTYRFYAEGASYSFGFTVSIKVSSYPDLPESITLNEGLDVVIYVGRAPIESVSVNDAVLSEKDYEVKDYCLRIDKSVFVLGRNSVAIQNYGTVYVTVTSLQHGDALYYSQSTLALSDAQRNLTILFSVLFIALCGVTCVGLIARRKGNKR